MTADALVQWAWNPGARTVPPVSQFDFHEAGRRWADGWVPSLRLGKSC